MKNCPCCSELLVFPRESYAYCEDCGWPDENFSAQYEYPKDGQQLEAWQPNLEFFNEKDGVWQKSGVIRGTFRECNFRGLYRRKVINALGHNGD